MTIEIKSFLYQASRIFRTSIYLNSNFMFRGALSAWKTLETPPEKGDRRRVTELYLFRVLDYAGEREREGGCEMNLLRNEGKNGEKEWQSPFDKPPGFSTLRLSSRNSGTTIGRRVYGCMGEENRNPKSKMWNFK
jgi:hypothetical protein